MYVSVYFIRKDLFNTIQFRNFDEYFSAASLVVTFKVHAAHKYSTHRQGEDRNTKENAPLNCVKTGY